MGLSCVQISEDVTAHFWHVFATCKVSATLSRALCHNAGDEAILEVMARKAKVEEPELHNRHLQNLSILFKAHYNKQTLRLTQQQYGECGRAAGIHPP